jgi:hypothetical protein
MDNDKSLINEIIRMHARSQRLEAQWRKAKSGIRDAYFRDCNYRDVDYILAGFVNRLETGGGHPARAGYVKAAHHTPVFHRRILRQVFPARRRLYADTVGAFIETGHP